MDCRTKFTVIGEDTEMMLTFGSKLWILSYLLFLVKVVDKIFSLIFCVNTYHHSHKLSVTKYNRNKVNSKGD